ncbi:MAG: hypothetical protein U9P12_06440 [Verrucomicrobiota bacterium]|nr:hypothetical protein [Verrucomicrobiota bacterium]
MIKDKTVPKWILEKLRTQTADNWESVRDEVVGTEKQTEKTGSGSSPMV